MKKILFSLVALVCSMSMNAQVMKVMKGNTVVATYTAAQADNVVFEEAQASTTTGTAKATIGGSEVDVNWVQLWENGPKFAEYNVGATSATEIGTTMTFTDATKTGDDYEWGSLWCTPSKDDMDELMKAATSTGSENVTCAIVRQDNAENSNIIGFRFTGKGDYASNSVFFPVQAGKSNYGYARYWSGTANVYYNAWYLRLDYDDGSWYSDWYSEDQGKNYLVRPVLKN